MSKKEHVLVNLGQFEDVTSPKQHANLKFLELNNAKKIQKGNCVLAPDAISA